MAGYTGFVMTLFEVVLKASHDCPFGNISRKFSSVKMFQWCNREREILEVVVERQEDYEPVMEEISKLGGILDRSSDRHKIHVVTLTCTCDKLNGVSKYVDALDVLHVSPIVYEQGWEYYRLIVFRHEDLKKLMEQLEENGFVFDIVRKVPFDGFLSSSLTLTADALFSDLTEKQMDALLTAYNYGYYRFPRRADVQTIAGKRRVPRTTFQEHLKKAENKLVVSLVPYVQLFKQASPEKRERLKIK